MRFVAPTGRRTTAVKSAIELGFPVAEIENWPALAQMLHEPRYRAFIENGPKGKRTKRSSGCPNQ